MSTIVTTDAFLVSRGGVNYQVTAANLMSTILDTDLLLVARGGTNFNVTGLDAKSYFGGGGYTSGEFVSGPGPYFYYNPNTQLVVGWSQASSSLPLNQGPATMFFSQDDGATWKFLATAGGGYFAVSTGAGVYQMAYAGLVFQNDNNGLVYQTSISTPTAAITSFAGVTSTFSGNTTITSSGGQVSGPQFPTSTGWVQNPNTGTIVKATAGFSGSYDSAWNRWTGWGTTLDGISAPTTQEAIVSLNYLPAVNRWVANYRGGLIYLSVNDGATFTASTGATNTTVAGFATDGTTIIGTASASAGATEVWVSTNGATSFSSGFTATGLQSVSIPFYVNGKFHYYASIDSGGTVFLRSSSNGTTWTERDVSSDFPGDLKPLLFTGSRNIGQSIVAATNTVFVGTVGNFLGTAGYSQTGFTAFPTSYFI